MFVWHSPLARPSLCCVDPDIGAVPQLSGLDGAHSGTQLTRQPHTRFGQALTPGSLLHPTLRLERKNTGLNRICGIGLPYGESPVGPNDT